MPLKPAENGLKQRELFINIIANFLRFSKC